MNNKLKNLFYFEEIFITIEDFLKFRLKKNDLHFIKVLLFKMRLNILLLLKFKIISNLY